MLPMNKKIIVALVGAVLLSLSALSTIISNTPNTISAQAQNQNNSSTQGTSITTVPPQGNTNQTGNNQTITAGNVTLQLHGQLDTAIVAAQNNDTLGVLMSLSQILQGLAEINRPAGNATEVAVTSSPETKHLTKQLPVSLEQQITPIQLLHPADKKRQSCNSLSDGLYRDSSTSKRRTKL